MGTFVTQVLKKAINMALGEYVISPMIDKIKGEFDKKKENKSN